MRASASTTLLRTAGRTVFTARPSMSATGYGFATASASADSSAARSTSGLGSASAFSASSSPSRRRSRGARRLDPDLEAPGRRPSTAERLAASSGRVSATAPQTAALAARAAGGPFISLRAISSASAGDTSRA